MHLQECRAQLNDFLFRRHKFWCHIVSLHSSSVQLESSSRPRLSISKSLKMQMALSFHSLQISDFFSSSIFRTTFVWKAGRILFHDTSDAWVIVVHLAGISSLPIPSCRKPFAFCGIRRWKQHNITNSLPKWNRSMTLWRQSVMSSSTFQLRALKMETVPWLVIHKQLTHEVYLSWRQRRQLV